MLSMTLKECCECDECSINNDPLALTLDIKIAGKGNFSSSSTLEEAAVFDL